MLTKSDIPAKQLSVELKIALREWEKSSSSAKELIDRFNRKSHMDLTRREKRLWWSEWLRAAAPVIINHRVLEGGRFSNKGRIHQVWMLNVQDRCERNTFAVRFVQYDERKMMTTVSGNTHVRISAHALEQVIRRKNEIGICNIGGILSQYVEKVTVMIMSGVAQFQQGEEFTAIDNEGYVGVMFDGMCMIIKTYIPKEQYHVKRLHHLQLLMDHLQLHKGFVITSRSIFDATYTSGQQLSIPDTVID